MDPGRCAGRKRRRSEEEMGPKLFHVVTLAPDVSLDGCNDDVESVLSIQSAETAFAIDTSDTCTKSSLSEPELSPMSLSASDLNDSSSDSSSIGVPGIINVVINVESNLSWADDSDTKSYDPEIPMADYWQCVCGSQKNSPVGRYCQMCFQLFQRRKENSLPRPKRKKKLKLKKSQLKKGKPGPTKLDSEPSTSGSQDSGASVGGAEDKCNGCWSAPINAAFYHTTFVHLWGCYTCSKRAWRSNKRCPICSCQSRVLRIYRS